MKQMEEEDEKEQDELRARINQLEADVENYNHLLVSWRERYQKLEMDFSQEQQLRKTAENELCMWKSANSNNTDAVPLPPRTAKSRPQNPALQIQTNPQQGQAFSEDVPMGCGKCTKDSHCECLEALANMSCGKCTKDSHCECMAQAFDMGNVLPNTTSISYKRSHSPPSATDSKRSRYTTSNGDTEIDATEIDFTTQYSARPPLALTAVNSATSMPAPPIPEDSCGFCQDGTACICAEMAADAAKNQDPIAYAKPQATPTRKPTTAIPNTCVNGPGTCAQCLSSSSSALFCKSIAATRPLHSLTTNPSPFAPSDHPRQTSDTSSTTTQAITGPTLSCADAYQTLSRHPAFEQASEELGTWVPELKTMPGGAAGGTRGGKAGSTEGFTAFEVEAASVMGVLRFFDRRFGKG